MSFENLVKRHRFGLLNWALDYIDKAKNPIFDEWCDYPGAVGKLDVQFSENDDDQSPNFNKVEVWVYGTEKDSEGNLTTNTKEGALIHPTTEPLITCLACGQSKYRIQLNKFDKDSYECRDEKYCA